MTHNCRLAAVCVALIFQVASHRTRAAAPGDNLMVLPPEPSPRRVLYSYLLGEAQRHFDARRAAVAEAMKSAEGLAKRRDALRAKFVEALGGFPAERSPLNARVVGVERRDGYRVQKVIYESRPNHHVTAGVYVPDGAGPFPAILMPCGHDKAGRADESLQRAAILYARNGFVVLNYDPIGQGERRQLIDAAGAPVISRMTTEHSVIGAGALLLGRNVATYRVWDGMRSLDYLCGRPDVDAKRVGCTGSSGGGMMTLYLMALDDRIAAAAPSCWLTSFERLFATIGPQDAEQNVTGQVAFGMEQSDYVTMFAPRPAVVLAGTQDFFDIGGTWTSFREAKRAYGVLGHPERVDLAEFDHKHGYPKEQRAAAVRWFRRWLQGKDDAPLSEREDEALFKPGELQCTKSGQVLVDLKGRSVVDSNVEYEAELATKRRALRAKLGDAAWLAEVRRTIALPEKISAAKFSEVGRIDRDGYAVRKLVFDTEPGVRVPGLMFEPAEVAEKSPLVVYVHGRGKGAEAGAGGAIERLVKQGNRVLAIDPRGVGETAPGVLPVKGPHYLGVDYNEAYVGFHIGRPLLGQRVFDVLAAAAAAARGEVRIVGVGTMGPVALHAAAMDQRFGTVTLERSLVSWAAVVKGVNENQLTNVVPGALNVYDLPELVDLRGIRVLVRDAVDASGAPITEK